MICRYKYCDNDTQSEYIVYCSIDCTSKATGYKVIDVSIQEEPEESEELVNTEG